MGQAFWTGVRLPSSPPESSGTVKNDLHFSQPLFMLYVRPFPGPAGAQQGPQQGPQAGAKKADDNVVDADYKVVDDDKK